MAMRPVDVALRKWGLRAVPPAIREQSTARRAFVNGALGLRRSASITYRTAYTRLKFRTLTAFFAYYIIAVSIIIPNFEYSNQSPMDKETISQYASELSELVQSFIHDYEHPEDGILIIKLDNIDEKKVVYIEDTLKPPYDEEDWAEYPLLDLMHDVDEPNEKWEIDPDAVLEVATDILEI